MTVSADFFAEPGEYHRHCGKPVGIRAIIAHAGTVSHSLPVISVPLIGGRRVQQAVREDLPPIEGPGG